ncbi:TlpA family protein disulfide reductase [Pseudoflavitalea sp. G-6-1-2]|nr:TlpA family protein disulfide reductase [Pseudoflavitalea sp. G-6-1-2]
MESMGTNFDHKKIDSAYKAMQTWKLTKEQRKQLDSIGDLGGSFNEEAAFKGSAAYRRWMDQQFTTLMYTKYSKEFSGRMSQEAIKQKAAAEAVSNTYIKNYWNYRFASQALKTSEDLKEADSIFQAFKTTNSHPAYAAGMEKTYERIKKFSKGAPAPEFEYQTVTGEKVTLSSLRGNFVYIDVWATWCGPCKAEIPNLKKVEEHYRDKNIKFVSISVDELKDAQKWKDYVINNELKGVQLMSDNAFNSAFIQDFNIISIPRFILIDTEGKIVSANAYRPSNKLLRTQLDQLLTAQN